MERSDKKVIEKYSKFINRDIKEIDTNIFTEDDITLIRRYLSNGILTTTSNRLLLLLQKIKLKRNPLDAKMSLLKNKADSIHYFYQDDVLAPLKELKTYEEELNGKNEKNLLRFLEKLKYYEIYSDDEKFQEYIQTLTIEEFKNILTTLNTKLNRLEGKYKKERITEINKVGTGNGLILNLSWYGATETVIEQILPKLLEAIKKLDNRKEQAALFYYTLNLLHIFKDGNGRTSRLIYDLAIGTDISQNLHWYFHTPNDDRQYEGSFEEERDIMKIRKLAVLLSKYNIFSLDLFNIKLPQELENKGIETMVNPISILNNIKMKDEIVEQLSQQEQKIISHLLYDNIGSGYYEIGGLIVLIIVIMKKELNKIPDTNNSSVISFNINEDEDLYATWNIEDFRNIYRIGNILKREMFIHLIEIFTNPNKYQEDSLVVKDIILNSKSKNKR